MKPLLMFRDRDFDPAATLPPQAEDLTLDLGLNILFDAMAADDAFLRGIAQRAVLSSLQDLAAISYRQEVLQDCVRNPDAVRSLYRLACEAIERERKVRGLYFFARSPELILTRSVEMMDMLVEVLRRLRSVAAEERRAFRSPGFLALFDMLARELGDDYIHAVQGHLQELRLGRSVLMSAQLGQGGKATNYILHVPPGESRSFVGRIFGKGSRTPSFSFEIADRDEAGHQAIAELRGRGLNLVANALAQAADHVLSFFTSLRAELGFYIGALNLESALAAKAEPICIPSLLPSGSGRMAASGLYDVCLALSLAERAVGNDLAADGKELVIVTGANQGGKSTFLRSVGLAQLMAQCGLFVGAGAFSADVCCNVLTHFQRPEDPTLQAGRLDEELGRMSRMVDLAHRGAMLLCNESFSSTNEQEGSEIGRQIIKALTESGVKVYFVTHLYDLAESIFGEASDRVLFLRADRLPDGRRTFRLTEAKPSPTSHGTDLYKEVFAEDGAMPGQREP